MKKLLSFVLCFTIAFAVYGGAGIGGSGYFDAAFNAEAASVEYESALLPYFFYGLKSTEQRDYLRIRQAIIDRESSIKVELDKNVVEKMLNIMYTADVLTCFNINTAEWIYSRWTGTVGLINFEYNYSKKDYDKIIRKAEEYSDEVLSRIKSKTNDYDKIKYIHDYIIDKCEYELDGVAANNIYGVFVKKSAKCDGYAHAFNYICSKAGIGVVTVCGREAPNSEAYHAWNKVLLDKKWYNVDCTWDDPMGNVKENKGYTYFMVSDAAIAANHVEVDLGFEIPAAVDNSINYFVRNNLVYGSKPTAKTMIASEIAKAAKKGRNTVTFRFANAETAEVMKDPAFLSSVLSAAGSQAGVDIITGCWQIGTSPNEMNTYTMMFFRKGTKLSDYYKDISKIDYEAAKQLEKLGVKTK